VVELVGINGARLERWQRWYERATHVNMIVVRRVVVPWRGRLSPAAAS
jgi:hypothetical protein